MSGTPRKSSEPSILIAGDKLGAYRIERTIGSGGMADVYYAIHEGLQRPAAIKVLRASLAADGIHLQRFLQEARAAASLVHPNIVQVYDVNQEGDHQYIAQEYVPGNNLRQYMAAASTPAQQLAETDPHDVMVPPQDRQLSLRETLSILLQVLAALTKSAASGIVHRDIKPENIMLTKDGDVKVADFGLARLLLGDDPQLTRAGTTLGTPMYMSPEQIQEGKVDVRSDLYSLGVTLYHMLSGRPPFTGETPLALAMQHVQATVPDIHLFREAVPDSLVELLSRLLAKSPSDRFNNPTEVLEFLRQHRQDDLKNDWPDHTIPLPGVSVSGIAKPMQATMALQSKLRERSNKSRLNLLSMIASVAFLLSAFGVGAALAYSTPFNLFESQDNYFSGIVKQPNIEEQYRWSLINTDRNPVTKWQAVLHFFPKEEAAKPLINLYRGLASLQLARVHIERKDFDEARKILKTTFDDREMEDLIRALAQLQIAVVESKSDNQSGRNAALDKALELAQGQNIKSADLPILDENISLMDQDIQDYWYDHSVLSQRDRPAKASR